MSDAMKKDEEQPSHENNLQLQQARANYPKARQISWREKTAALNLERWKQTVASPINLMIRTTEDRR